MTAPGDNLEVGRVLEDRYLLERVIGEGGMGIVFAARHIELGETVAVKVLHSSSADDGQLERFLREARLAAKIKSEHVVRIVDVARGRRGTAPYIVMEYLDGVDLSTLLNTRGPLEPTEAVDYVLQACEALVEAHALGIVHRDLKPSNLFLTRRSDGTPLVKVLDFGISKAHDEEHSKLTTTQAVFGSPAYMSPEQIRSAKHVDQRADVWALAVVLFEVMTGQLPFVGDTAPALLAAIAADTPLRLTQLARSAPPGLERVIDACLVKDRERRVSSIRELAAMLAPFASPLGQASSVAVTRIASQPRVLSNAAPGSSGSLPPGGITATLHDPMAARQGGVGLRFDASGRTDRAVVTAPRAASPRRPILVALAALGASVVLASGYWLSGRGSRVRTVPSATAVMVEPPPPPAVSLPVASMTATATVVPSTVPPAPPFSVAPSPVRANTAKPGHPRTAPPPPVSASHPMPPAPAPSKPNVDIDSRQ